jgi:hypothetical protein
VLIFLSRFFLVNMTLCKYHDTYDLFFKRAVFLLLFFVAYIKVDDYLRGYYLRVLTYTPLKKNTGTDFGSHTYILETKHYKLKKRRGR